MGREEWVRGLGQGQGREGAIATSAPCDFLNYDRFTIIKVQKEGSKDPS